MKYSNEIVIDQPLTKTIELFDSPDNLKYWQKGLVSYEHVSGTPGQAGAKAKFRFKSGKREFDMMETVIEITFQMKCIVLTMFRGSQHSKELFQVGRGQNQMDF